MLPHRRRALHGDEVLQLPLRDQVPNRLEPALLPITAAVPRPEAAPLHHRGHVADTEDLLQGFLAVSTVVVGGGSRRKGAKSGEDGEHKYRS